MVFLSVTGLGANQAYAGAVAQNLNIGLNASAYLPLVPIVKNYPEKLKQRLKQFRKKTKRPTKTAFDVNELKWGVVALILSLIFVPPAVLLFFGLMYSIMWMLWVASIVAGLVGWLFLIVLGLDYGQVFSDDMGVLSYLVGTLFQIIGVPNLLALGIAALLLSWWWVMWLSIGLLLFIAIFWMLSYLTI